MTRQTDFNAVSGRPAHEFGRNVYYWSNGTNTTGAEFQKYATGGIYHGGSAIMGEVGPEFVDSSPGYVYRADETKALFAMARRGVESSDNYKLDLTEVVTELKAIRSENSALRREVAQLRQQQAGEHAEDIQASGKVAIAVGGNGAAMVRN